MSKPKYMHLIENRPAFFSRSDGQICYATKENPVKLRTYKEIRKDKSITVKNRKKWGYKNDKIDYSYIKVVI